MANNAFEMLCNSHPKMVSLLRGNEDVSAFIQSMYSHMVDTMSLNGIDIRNLRTEVFLADDNTLKVALDYPTLHTGRYVDRRVLYRRSVNIARMMEVNANVTDLAVLIFERLAQWAAKNGISMKDVRIKKAILARGGRQIVATIEERKWLEDLEPEERWV